MEDLIQQLRLSESNRIYLRKSEDDPLDDKFFKLSLDGSRVTIKISKVDFDELYVGTLLDDLLKTNLRVGSPNAPIILIDVEEYQKLLEKSKVSNFNQSNQSITH